jgi:DNA-binding NarL/FixJ family response regulator
MAIRVLIVDDHNLVRQALRLLLESSEFTVCGEAADGKEALARVRALKPDVVLMDISMPGMDGLEASRQIAAANGPPVLALSTHADKSYVRRALEAGAVGYVLKLSSFDELSVAIKAAFRGEGFLSDKIEDLADVQDRLSPRERQVLKLVAEGKTSAQIALDMSVTVETVSTHRRNICRKLGVSGTADLAKLAVRDGLTTP